MAVVLACDLLPEPGEQATMETNGAKHWETSRNKKRPQACRPRTGGTPSTGRESALLTTWRFVSHSGRSL
jgi:hypothetical protein